ncbi:hypothetical protein FZW96_04465 [Bacillus sp. BGMRC 2118]|nr:hypothetical protein FZW96_04465 [Bacillus sp. BGMRC 2118]
MGNVLLFYGGLVGALITLPITIFIFFKLNIKQVIEDLTGMKLTKSITDKKEREKRGTGKIAKPVTNELKLRKDQGNQEVAASSTETLHHEVEATSLITQSPIDETLLLDEELEETTILQEEVDETTLLKEGEDSDFVVELDTMVVHSENVI